jgi:predicted SprT family Zn-dependent metalloprotease
MRVPKRFRLMGQIIDVVYRPDQFRDSGWEGVASYQTNQIVLQPSSDAVPLKPEALEQTFLHEMVHFILYHSGAAYTGKRDYMHQDEGFVDLTASLLHQALTTMEYDD